MRFPALLSLAVLVSGCLFVVDDHHDDFDDGGILSVTWVVMEGGAESTCEAVGGVTVRMVAKHEGTGEEREDLLDCVDYGGRTAPLLPGDHIVFIELLDGDDRPLTEPFSVGASVYPGEESPAGHFEFAFPAGALHATWSVLVNEQPVNCSDVGATEVVFESTRLDGAFADYEEPWFDTFNCEAGQGTTGLFPAGTYSVRVSLRDADGTELSWALVNNFVIADRQDRAFGHIEFPLVSHKALFQARMGTLGGNCDLIVQQEIRVRSEGRAQCIAYKLGSEPNVSESGETFACQRTSCQAETTVQVLQNLGDGDYTVEALGYKAGPGNQPKLCYVSPEVPFTIDGADKNLGTLTAVLDTSLCDGP